MARTSEAMKKSVRTIDLTGRPRPAIAEPLTESRLLEAAARLESRGDRVSVSSIQEAIALKGPGNYQRVYQMIRKMKEAGRWPYDPATDGPAAGARAEAPPAPESPPDPGPERPGAGAEMGIMAIIADQLEQLERLGAGPRRRGMRWLIDWMAERDGLAADGALVWGGVTRGTAAQAGG